MKVTKCVDLESQEIEIEIGTDDIKIALSEAFAYASTSSTDRIKGMLNTCAQFLNALTPEQIASLGDPTRNVVHKFFHKQAGRFMSDRPRVRVEIEGSTKEAAVILVSDNRKSLMLDLCGDGVQYRSGAVLLNFLALLADEHGEEGDYRCLITGVPAKVTWL